MVAPLQLGSFHFRVTSFSGIVISSGRFSSVTGSGTPTKTKMMTCSNLLFLRTSQDDKSTAEDLVRSSWVDRQGYASILERGIRIPTFNDASSATRISSKPTQITNHKNRDHNG